MKVGSQIPRIRIEPDRVTTDGTGAAMLMAEYSYKLDEWQKLILDCWLGKNADGEYTVTSAGLSLPRQNGKNFAIEAREFYGLVVNGERILHTAHQLRVSKRAFRRLTAMFTDKKHPEVMSMLKQIRYANGEESIELNNGGVIEFSARSRQAARGFDGISLVVFDEAQELEESQIEALMATLSASATGTRQIIYCGTPPYPGCPGNVFRRYRQSCIDAYGKNEVTCNAWHEWSIPSDDLENIDIDDRSLWYDVNPALGLRLTEEFTKQEHDTLAKDGFCRERLGLWMKPPEESEQTDFAINRAAWETCVSDDPKPDGKTAYGIKFTADGSAVCLCGAVIPPMGKTRVSFIQMEPVGNGLQWLADWLNERYTRACCVVIDGRNGADVLIDKISDVWRWKGSVIKPSAKDLTNAVGLLTNAVNEGAVTWFRGQEVLYDSAITSTKRIIGQGWGFGGANSAPIEACALALFGAKTSRRDPTKKMRIG